MNVQMMKQSMKPRPPSQRPKQRGRNTYRTALTMIRMTKIQSIHVVWTSLTSHIASFRSNETDEGSRLCSLRKKILMLRFFFVFGLCTSPAFRNCIGKHFFTPYIWFTTSLKYLNWIEQESIFPNFVWQFTGCTRPLGSSVGRASDCNGYLKSECHWFDPGPGDTFCFFI